MKGKVWKILGLISIVIFVLSAANLVHAVTVLSIPSTIAVGGNPQYAAYDSAKGEIFVTNQGDGSVSVISDGSNSVVQTIANVGQYPTGIAYDSQKGEMFVTDEGDGTNNGSVAVISDSSNSVVQTITVGVGPEGIAYDSGKGELFVANSDYNQASQESNAPPSTVSVISDSSNTVVATITVGVGPIGVAYDSGKNEVFVSNELSSTVSVISDSNNQVVKTVSAGNGPEGLAYDSAKGEIYVADEVDGGFEAISDGGNSVVATNTLGSQTYSGNPNDLAYDSSKGEIFEETGTYIVAISDTSNNVVAYAPLVQLPISSDSYGPVAMGVAYDSSKGEIFIVDGGSNGVSVLSDSFSGSSSSTPTPASSSTTTSTPSSTTATSAPSTTSNNILFIIVGIIVAVVIVGGIVGFKFTGRKGKTVGSVGSASGSSDLGKPASEGAPKTDDSTSSLENENTSKPVVQEPNPPTQQSQTQTTQPTQQSQQPQQKPLTQQERTERFRKLVNTFQQKGATSPEKAMTAEQLGLPPRFEDFMERRAGQTKVFQEVNGKYYLDQKALKEMRQQWANRKQ